LADRTGAVPLQLTGDRRSAFEGYLSKAITRCGVPGAAGARCVLQLRGLSRPRPRALLQDRQTEPQETLTALADTIAAVAAGEAIFGPGLARRALQVLSSSPEPAFAELTRREREVLELIASGLSNHAIAAKLGLSTNTISNHISSIFSKLQVSSRAEAIVRARSAGLGE
jgi:DNA-binding NarL/FixJ family response regulator